MASPNGSGRPSGCVTIPVEIIRDSSSTGAGGSHSRHNSPFRTQFIDNQYGGFSDSPPWNPNSTSRFQQRQSPNPAYDRVITNSQFNQPFDDRASYQQYQEPQNRYSQQRMYEPSQSHFSRSSEDLLSSPFDSMRFSTQPQYTSLIPPSFGSGFRQESDFVLPNKTTTPLRRSYDALNDFSDMHHSFPTTRQYPSEQQQQQQQQQQQPYYRTTYQPQSQSQQQQQQPTYVNQTYINPDIVYTNEYGAPTDRFQPNTFQGTSNIANDRSRSPASQRGASPARPPPSATQQQQQQPPPPEEPELKMAKDTTGPIPMPAPASSTSSQSTDEQVLPTDTSAAANASPPQPEPIRDPNTIALEKLELIKQSLADLELEVDAFVGSTRNERAYKILDEQGLKIMIRCDELVDVSADIKEKRKEIIRNVQRVIGKLESKVPATSAASNNSNPIATASSNDKSSVNTNAAVVNDNKQENTEKKSSPSSSPPKENAAAPSTTEQIISTEKTK